MKVDCCKKQTTFCILIKIFILDLATKAKPRLNKRGTTTQNGEQQQR